MYGVVLLRMHTDNRVLTEKQNNAGKPRSAQLSVHLPMRAVYSGVVEVGFLLKEKLQFKHLGKIQIIFKICYLFLQG